LRVVAHDPAIALTQLQDFASQRAGVLVQDDRAPNRADLARRRARNLKLKMLIVRELGNGPSAIDEARAAYSLGEQKHDYILMARARLLECMVENTKLDEEIEDSAWVSHLALEASKEAVELAQRTENRRLLARALIWHGLTLSNTSPGNLDAARRALAANRFDVAVLDIALALGSGFELLHELRDSEGDAIPLIVFAPPDANLGLAAQVRSALIRARTSIDDLVAMLKKRLAGSSLPSNDKDAA